MTVAFNTIDGTSALGKNMHLSQRGSSEGGKLFKMLYSVCVFAFVHERPRSSTSLQKVNTSNTRRKVLELQGQLFEEY